MWRPQLEAMSRAGWRVIAPDLRGYGETPLVGDETAEKATLDVFANDIIALMDSLGVARFVIAGLSMGGQIAMEVARLHPSRLRGIALLATFPRAESSEGRKTRRDMADRLLREGMDAYASEILDKMLDPRTIAERPEIAAHVLGMMRATSPVAGAAALRGRAERPPYEPVLAALDVPALIVVGDRDAFTTRADAEQMHILLKRSRLLWIEGVGHMPNLESEAAVNAALQQLLLDVDA
jgi:pimeloyl-ACP methyl ester carboxylesterase